MSNIISQMISVRAFTIIILKPIIMILRLES